MLMTLQLLDLLMVLLLKVLLLLMVVMLLLLAMVVLEHILVLLLLVASVGRLLLELEPHKCVDEVRAHADGIELDAAGTVGAAVARTAARKALSVDLREKRTAIR